MISIEAFRTRGRRPGRMLELDEEIAMTRLPVPPIAPEIVETIRQSIQAGKTREEVFAEMRQRGLFIGYSIKLTHELYGIPLGEAKRAVHFSET